MDLSFSDEDLSFQADVRAFLRSSLPSDLARREAQGFPLERRDLSEWHGTVYRQGWIAPNWPKEFGGTGWTPIQRHIFSIEYGVANAPELSVFGLSLVGPVIFRFGSDDLKQRFLEPILRGDIWFCQGFSEPQAGSDLASLRTRAILDGNDYVITGQKIWTTAAHMADYMICLARTDATTKPQAGLSMILVPMDAPGVTVRHIPTINGEHEVNEVFLDEVRVPVANLVGVPNTGWAQAKYLLNHERTHNAYVGILRRYLDRIPGQIDGAAGQGLSLAGAEEYRRSYARLAIDVDALEWSVLRVLASPNGPELNAAASALKIRGSELLLRAGELELAISGAQIAPQFDRLDQHPLKGNVDPCVPGKATQYLFYRATSIFGGANEIQRGIIWNTLFRA